MAKGFEDTALYVYARLISLNEVGGDPARFGRTPNEVHHFLRSRGDRYPGGLSPLSTHDTKRSEDVRARIDVLSELPHAWVAHVTRWMELNRPLKTDIGEGELAPDANEEYFLYQTLIGAWPQKGLTADNRADFVQRIQAYFHKALHEAKVHTTWINPNPEYDAAAEEFVARILDPDQSGPFVADFESFQRTINRCGMFNSLAQTLIRVTAPGVPDTYQGTELWDFSLVDPDNRRPVDYDQRTRALSELDTAGNQTAVAQELLRSIEDGRIKLHVVSRALRFRRDHANLFARGIYIPIEVRGARSRHAFCFMREHDADFSLVVVPRLIGGLSPRGSAPIGSEVWQNTAVIMSEANAPRRWRNVFTGELLEADSDRSLSLASILAHFPVALLEPARD